MKTKMTSALLCLLLLLLVGCTQAQNPPQPQTEILPAEPEQTAEPRDISFEGTNFYYEGCAYDLAAREAAINAVLSAVPVGEKIVVECHVGPQNGIYCIFDTKTQEFEKDIAGNHLTWYGDTLETAVYAFWSEVYAYDGTLLRAYDLAENEWIYALAFSDDRAELHVTIFCDDGTERIDTIAL